MGSIFDIGYNNRKGGNESHSCRDIVSVYGGKVTIGRVRWPDIAACYLPERVAGSGKCCYLDNTEEEFNASTFRTSFYYCGEYKDCYNKTVLDLSNYIP